MCSVKRYRLLLLFAGLLAGRPIAAEAQPAPPPEAPRNKPVLAIKGPGQCVPCHAALQDAALSSPTRALAFDRHAKAGMGCADCHGGDPAAKDKAKAHDPAAGYIGIPGPRQIPELCARCHSNPEFIITQNPKLAVDQYEKYQTSRHGQLLKMGLRKVAQCTSCHTAHNIRPASDPRSSIYPVNLPRTCAHCHGDREYMQGFPIPNDQFEKYSTSVHGRALLEKEDLGAPACNGCHGNHGAVPPGAKSLAHVCGTCHALNAEMFEKSPHAKAFADKELPQCTVCHEHHAITPPTARTFAMEAGSVCITCHRQDDAGWKAGKRMYGAIEEMEGLRGRAEAGMNEAQKKGMDVTEGRFLLQDYRKNFLQMRTISHELDAAAFEEKVKETREKVAGALAVADAALAEYQFRRHGLLVSLALCLPVLFFLRLKIRQIDRKQKTEERRRKTED